MLCRGLGVGIYPTSSPEACQFILENSKANIVVVENDKQLQKILEVSLSCDWDTHTLKLIKISDYYIHVLLVCSLIHLSRQ